MPNVVVYLVCCPGNSAAKSHNLSATPSRPVEWEYRAGFSDGSALTVSRENQFRVRYGILSVISKGESEERCTHEEFSSYMASTINSIPASSGRPDQTTGARQTRNLLHSIRANKGSRRYWLRSWQAWEALFSIGLTIAAAAWLKDLVWGLGGPVAITGSLLKKIG